MKREDIGWMIVASAILAGVIVLLVGPGCAHIPCGTPWTEPCPEPTPTPTPEPPDPPDPDPDPDPEPPDPEPPDPPDPPVADYPGRTAEEIAESGGKVVVQPQVHGRVVRVTPLADHGNEYYCLPEVNWPEACAGGRTYGPVAPDGHPKRQEWESAFYGQPCATVYVRSDEHMSLDPWIVLQGVNQNHPDNVEYCSQEQFEDDPSWVKEPYNGRLYIVRGQMSWSTVHGNGQVCAEAAGGYGRRCRNFQEPR